MSYVLGHINVESTAQCEMSPKGTNPMWNPKGQDVHANAPHNRDIDPEAIQERM